MNYQFGNAKQTARRNRKICNAVFSLLGLFAIAAIFAGTATSTDGLTAGGLMCFGPMAFVPRMDKDPEGGGGGGAMTQDQFQGKVIETLGTQNEKLDKFQQENKTLLDEITRLKEAADGSEESIKALELKVSKFALKQHAAIRRSTGDPIRDILADPEKKTLINAMVRSAVKAPLSDDHKKALSSGSTPGSTFLQDALMTDIYDTLSSYGVWNSFDVRNVSTLNNKFLVKTARPVALVFGEGITITEDSNKAGVSVTHTAKGIKVLLSVPNELLEDSEIDLSQDILTDFIEAVAYRMDFMCLTADGTNDGTNGAQTGIFEGGTAAVAATGNTTVETLDFEDVTATLLAVDEAVMGRGACWWIHPQMLVRLLHIKDLNGRPIFLTATEAPAPGAMGTLLGYPVKLSSAAPNTNAASKPIAAFGDPKGLVAGLRKKFEFKTSTEANFQDDETVFRGIARFGCKIRRAQAFGILTTAAS